MSRRRLGDKPMTPPERAARHRARAKARLAALEAEASLLRAGWLCMLQYKNYCDATRNGFCNATPEHCGCRAEMAQWMKEAKT